MSAFSPPAILVSLHSRVKTCPSTRRKLIFMYTNQNLELFFQFLDEKRPRPSFLVFFLAFFFFLLSCRIFLLLVVIGLQLGLLLVHKESINEIGVARGRRGKHSSNFSLRFLTCRCLHCISKLIDLMGFGLSVIRNNLFSCID